MKMLPVQYWNIWTWLMLGCALLNVYFFFTGGGILSLVFGAFCGFGFYRSIK
jgi:hypothetical protein